MKYYTTKPRIKSFKLSYNRKKQFVVTFKRATKWTDLHKHTPKLAQASVWNDIGMAVHGGKTSNYLTDIANVI